MVLPSAPPQHVQHHGTRQCPRTGRSGSRGHRPRKDLGDLISSPSSGSSDSAPAPPPNSSSSIGPFFAHLAAHRLGQVLLDRAAEVFALLDGGQPFGQEGPAITSQWEACRVEEGNGNRRRSTAWGCLFHHGDSTVGGTVIKSDEHTGRLLALQKGWYTRPPGLHNPAAGSITWRQRLGITPLRCGAALAIDGWMLLRWSVERWRAAPPDQKAW